MISKLFVLAAASFATSIASASFEMVLVLDKGTSSVHRFDGMTGNYLGSFGGGLLTTPEAMTLNQQENLVYIKNGTNGIFAFNYNTGELKGANVSISASTGLFWDGLYICRTTNSFSNYFTQVQSPTVSGSFSHITLPTTAVWRHVGKDMYGDYIWINDSDSIVRTNGSTFSGAEQSITLADSSVALRRIAIKDTYGYITSDATDQIIKVNTQSLSANTATAIGTYIDAPQGIAFGHNTLMYVCGLKPGSSTQGQIWRTFSDNMAISFGVFGSSYLQNPVDLAVVVAPEPSTLGIFALVGAAALLRRRSRSS